MKYILKHIETKEEHLCDKVTIDGFDYYVNDEINIVCDNLWVVEKRTNYLGKTFYPKNDGTVTDDIIKKYLLSVDYKGHYTTTVDSGCNLAIASTNPNIDIPKVVDEVEEFIKSFGTPENGFHTSYIEGVKEGYNKAKEKYGNSDDDMIKLIEWMQTPAYLINVIDLSSIKASKEIFEIWKSQQPQIIYYQNENLVCGSCGTKLNQTNKDTGLCFKCGYELASAK